MTKTVEDLITSQLRIKSCLFANNSVCFKYGFKEKESGIAKLGGIKTEMVKWVAIEVITLTTHLMNKQSWNIAVSRILRLINL